jgi:hypothetical protein
MHRPIHPGSSWIVFLVLALGLFATPARAGVYLGAKIEWCWSPTYPNYFPIRQRYFIEVIYPPLGQQVGDTIMETFDFGDGTSAPVTLTVTEVRGDRVVAKGEIRSGEPQGSAVFVRAGLSDCCRSGDLNNRAGGNFAARVLVYRQGEELCSPTATLPGTLWRSGGLGDTFTIPLPVGLRSASEGESLLCHFATDAQAGGGPNADGLSLDPATCTLTWTPTGGDPERLWTTQVQAEEYLSNGEFRVATTVLDFTLGLDPGRPVCQLASSSASGITVLARDLRSGIETVTVLEAVNANVQIPPFAPGTTAPLSIAGSKIDLSRSSRISLRLTDAAGNVTDCDPVLTEVERQTGKPVSQTWTVPAAERFVTVLNGAPGLRHLEVEVNGRRYRLNDLRDDEERTLDVSAAVRAGEDSTVTLTPHGKPGGSAAVLIHD